VKNTKHIFFLNLIIYSKHAPENVSIPFSYCCKSKGGRFKNEFRKSQIRKFAFIFLDVRTFRKCSNLRNCDLRTIYSLSAARAAEREAARAANKLGFFFLAAEENLNGKTSRFLVFFPLQLSPLLKIDGYLA
jgi:hypothetical protein